MKTPNWIAVMRPNNVISWLAFELWCFGEWLPKKTGVKLPLFARFAPHIFGLMMGKKGTRIQ